MRATSRTVFLALAAAHLACTGCASQRPLTLAQPFVPETASRVGPGLGDVVSIEAPRPLGDPAGDAAVPFVWRASSRSVHSDVVVDDAPAPVVPAGLHVGESRRHAPALPPPTDDLPRELNKVTMPPYRVEPPDVLLINALRVVPKPPYRIEPLDDLLIQAPPAQVMPNEPISGRYPVGPDGQIDLGYSYGKVAVAGMTTDQARAAIAKHVADVHGIKAPAVVVALGQTRGVQQIRGEHLVRPDGTVSLGAYGEAYVAGLTLAEVKHAVEAQLSRALLDPQVTVDVQAYNSKVYYVIYDGGGYGQQIYKLPVVGGETVLDALAELHGLPASSSTHRIWVARPVPGQVGCRQILPVDWAAITEGGAADTNYQLFPGDRIYVKADHWVALDRKVSKVLAPFQRLFGITLLGDATVRVVGGLNGCPAAGY
jgi:polysaccharide export outer membrane protein